MADSVVAFLLGYLPNLLIDEANFLAGVEDRVKSLIRELRMINIFLKNSLGKRNDEMVKEVVGQIREAAYEAEDIIDIFILEVTEYRKRSPIGRMLHIPSHAKRIRNVGTKIVGINETINQIYNNRGRYGIEGAEASVHAEDETLHRHRRQVEEDDVVGFDDYSARLVKQLTQGDRKLDVISIIGMGGLGKTTLA